MWIGLRSLGVALVAVALSGCGVGNFGAVAGGGSGGAGQMQGNVHGGQQPVALAKVYLYAVSTTSVGGASTSLLSAPGYVLTDLNGNFSITGDYTCPAGAYVYLLALGGNPGLTGVVSNPQLALASGVGACSGLSASSFYTINEATTVATASSLASFAVSETQIGGPNSMATAPAFFNVTNLVDLTKGVARATDPLGATVPQAEVNSLGNALAACVNSSGVGGTCAQLMSLTGTAGAGGTPVDTFQAALNIANNPTVNVAAIYNLGAANGPLQPSLAAAPANWTVTVPAPPTPSQPTGSMGGAPGNLPFFAGQTAQGNGVEYLVLPNGTVFGYYSYLPDARYIYHYDMGYEYTVDAADGQGGVYFYDFQSGHYWYTSPVFPFPYIYDFTLNAVIYYYPDTQNAGHYTTNPRYFYNYATGQIFSQ